MTTFRQLLEFFEQSAKTQAAKGQAIRGLLRGVPADRPVVVRALRRGVGLAGLADRPVGLPDTGVDLVARERGTGDLVAIQCKFYSPSAVLRWEHVSTFVAMLSQDVFSSGMLISTAGAESSNLHKNLTATSKDVTWFRVENFEESRVDWNQFRPDAPTQLSLADRKTLRPHQQARDRRRGRRLRRWRGPRPDDHGVRHRQDVHVAAPRRAGRRRRRLGAVPRAVDQPVVADRRRMGERRRGPARDLRCVFGPSRRQAQQERRGHVGQRPPSPGIDRSSSR